jgi:hypothetical protein
MITAKEEFEQMGIIDLLDEVLDLSKGDMWDGFMSKTCRANYELGKEVLKIRILKLQADATTTHKI